MNESVQHSEQAAHLSALDLTAAAEGQTLAAAQQAHLEQCAYCQLVSSSQKRIFAIQAEMDAEAEAAADLKAATSPTANNNELALAASTGSPVLPQSFTLDSLHLLAKITGDSAGPEEAAVVRVDYLGSLPHPQVYASYPGVERTTPQVLEWDTENSCFTGILKLPLSYRNAYDYKGNGLQFHVESADS